MSVGEDRCERTSAEKGAAKVNGICVVVVAAAAYFRATLASAQFCADRCAHLCAARSPSCAKLGASPEQFSPLFRVFLRQLIEAHKSAQFASIPLLTRTNTTGSFPKRAGCAESARDLTGRICPA